MKREGASDRNGRAFQNEAAVQSNFGPENNRAKSPRQAGDDEIRIETDAERRKKRDDALLFDILDLAEELEDVGAALGSAARICDRCMIVMRVRHLTALYRALLFKTGKLVNAWPPR
jgi:hypothetical protein